VFSYLHLSDDDAGKLVADRRIAFVCFTGSVATGRKVQQAAAAAGFAGVGLELGGKDPAYVRADANLDHAIENLMDGAFFNSGQSCCAIERLYVHEKLYDKFIDGAVTLARSYRLGNPTDPSVNIGPLVHAAAADFVRGQVADAVKAGAKALVGAADKPGSPYMAPEILTGVDHSMRLMRDETFGPVVGVMKVASDEEAIALMNDSPFGLTAAIWTQDPNAANSIGARLEAGTIFMNRCDYLDPALAWTGVKESGRGCTLSRLGYEQLTRPKSFHFRLAT
jgi:acyl-CoA reductase-like NAD-dependent aldehyde dehydrogenase